MISSYTWDEKFLKETGSTAYLMEGNILYTAEFDADSKYTMTISRYEVRENCTNVLYRSFNRRILIAEEFAGIDDWELYAFAMEAVRAYKEAEK